MNLGRVQQGDWLRIPVWTQNTTPAPAWPTDGSGNVVFPHFTIISPVLAHQVLVIQDAVMTAVKRGESAQLGHHYADQRIGPEFPAGFYYVLVDWQVASASVNRACLHIFEVVAGGDANGAYTALHCYEQPQATFLVGQLDSGRLDVRRNPKVTP